MGATIGRMKNIGKMNIGSYMDTYHINRRLAKLDNLITCEDMIQKNAARNLVSELNKIITDLGKIRSKIDPNLVQHEMDALKEISESIHNSHISSNSKKMDISDSIVSYRLYDYILLSEISYFRFKLGNKVAYENFRSFFAVHEITNEIENLKRDLTIRNERLLEDINRRMSTLGHTSK